MRLQSHARILSSDGEPVGHLERVVIDPRTDEVTHLVIEKGLLFTEERVVPVEEMSASVGERVELKLSAAELADAPRFVERDFLQLGGEKVEELELEVAPFYYLHPPGDTVIAGSFPRFPEQPMVEKKSRNIPQGSIALEAVEKVYDAMGELIGDVEQVLVDSEDESVNHLIISRGMLLKERKVIPLAWVREVQESRIGLGVSGQILDQMPGYET
jgi:sporulation protein YlmC with PRC-barrel domain